MPLTVPSAAATPGDRFLEVPGARLRFREEGRGPATLLIHGWTLDLDMWDAQVRGLRDCLRLVRFDRRGFGLSCADPDGSRDVMDIRALCRHLQIARLAVVGMSQGARAAVLLAGAAPELVSCLVLDGPPELVAGEGSFAPDVPFAEYRNLAMTAGLAEVRRLWLQHPLAALRTSDADTRQLLESILARYPGNDLRTDSTAQPVETLRLQELRLPVLVLNGALDVKSRLAAGRALEHALPDATRIVIAGAGHMANLDRPRDYNEVLRTFILRHTRAGDGELP